MTAGLLEIRDDQAEFGNSNISTKSASFGRFPIRNPNFRIPDKMRVILEVCSL